MFFTVNSNFQMVIKQFHCSYLSKILYASMNFYGESNSEVKFVWDLLKIMTWPASMIKDCKSIKHMNNIVD